MKKVKLFSFALAALMLGACSSEDGIDNGGQGTVLPGEKGYISLAINLPTTPSTRANDDFDDGLEAEYKVNDATLLIFNGTDEGTAVFSGAYDLGSMTPTSVGGNITASYNVTQEITKPGAGNVYALVVVNKGNVLINDGEWKLKGESLTGKTFDYFRTTAQTLTASELASVTSDAEGSFFMTNAPLYTNPGGVTDPNGGNAVTLTKINTENIYSTQAEAEDNPAASIYVERAVAKVTVTNSNTGSAGSSLTYAITGWTLDVTNTKSYIVRNVKGADWWSYKAATSNDYRFVGSAAVAAGLYRTYWAYDPNYASLVEDDFTKLEGTTPASLTEVGKNAYCLENTFNVANMNQNQTTRVIVAAKLTMAGAEESGDFYILDNDKNTIFTKENAVKAIKAEYLTNPAVVAALQDPTTGLNEGQYIGEADLTVNFDSKETTGGDLTVTEITISEDRKGDFKGGAIPAVLKADGNNDIIAAVNAGKKVSYYKGGIAYYPVLIRHFDESQTPWNNAEYNNNGNDYLGRYGVLRNNWYNIDVTAIKTIGSADVPDVYGTPDDPMESWISVEINVLSWAKRSQSVDL